MTAAATTRTAVAVPVAIAIPAEDHYTAVARLSCLMDGIRKPTRADVDARAAYLRGMFGTGASS